MLYAILKTLVLPPTSLFILFLVAWLLKKRWPRLGRALLWGLLLVVYLATTPFIAGELMAPLQPYGAVDTENPDPDVDAIIVLSAGLYSSAPEYWQPTAPSYGVDAAGSLTLQRLQYAAYLSKAIGKPILVTGGLTGPDPDRSIAQVMSRALEEDFGVPVRWVENQADSTRTNAELSAKILRAEGVDKVYLVTHAWHMPRAMFSFLPTGLEVVPAPTRFFSRADPLWTDFIPSAQAFHGTYYAIHEWVGILWYRLRT